MSDELSGVLDDQGQAGDSEANQGPIRLGVDLDTTVEGRALKSSLQSQTAQQQQRAEYAERRAEEAERRADEALRKAEFATAQAQAVVNGVRNVDPDTANLLVKEAEIAQKDAELAYYKQATADREAREAEQARQREVYQGQINWWHQNAAGMGVDPSNLEFQAALARTMQDGNSQHAFTALSQIVMKQQRGGGQQQPENTEPDYVSPPSGGGSRVSPDKRLMDDYLSKRKSLQGQPGALADLKMEYRRKGLQID